MSSTSQLAALSAEISTLARNASASLVAITHKRHAISGFFWKSDVVVTVSEGLEAKRDDVVDLHKPDGTTTTGTVIGRDPGTDLVLIKTEGSAPALKPAANATVMLGQAVVAVGRTPHGATAAPGFATLVGGAWRSMRGGDLGQRVWLDVRIPRAAEGSAVLDADGGLLGMAVFGPRRRVVLIPAETIERAGAELLAHGRIRRGYLGVGVQAVAMPTPSGTTSDGQHVGLMVMGLDDNGPAATAGILRGDILTAIDGKSPHSGRSLARLLSGTMIGQAKTLDLVRAGQPTQVTVTIGEFPHK